MKEKRKEKRKKEEKIKFGTLFEARVQESKRSPNWISRELTQVVLPVLGLIHNSTNEILKEMKNKKIKTK